MLYIHKSGQDRYKKGERGGQWKPKDVPDGTPDIVAKTIMVNRKATSLRVKLERMNNRLSRHPHNKNLRDTIGKLTEAQNKLNASASHLRKTVRDFGYNIDAGGKIKSVNISPESIKKLQDFQANPKASIKSRVRTEQEVISDVVLSIEGDIKSASRKGIYIKMSDVGKSASELKKMAIQDANKLNPQYGNEASSIVSDLHKKMKDTESVANTMRANLKGRTPTDTEISDFAKAKVNQYKAFEDYYHAHDKLSKEFPMNEDGTLKYRLKPSGTKATIPPATTLPPHIRKPDPKVPPEDDAGWIEWHPSLPKDTAKSYQVDGEYVPERKRVHEQIVNEFFNGKEKVPDGMQKISTLMMGVPGSGKSTVSRQMNNDDNYTINVEADAIKEMLPEYAEALSLRAKNAGSMVHDESLYIANMIREKAISEGYNVRIDGTGNYVPAYVSMINTLHNEGHKVRLIAVNMPLDKAIDGANIRGKNTGRFVPENRIRTTHKNMPGNFKIYSGLVDEYVVADSTDGWPPKPIAIKRMGDSEPTVTNSKALKNSGYTVKSAVDNPLSVTLDNVLNSLSRVQGKEFLGGKLKPGETGAIDDFDDVAVYFVESDKEKAIKKKSDILINYSIFTR